MARKDSAGFPGYIEMVIHYARLFFRGVPVGLGSRRKASHEASAGEEPRPVRDIHNRPSL